MAKLRVRRRGFKVSATVFRKGGKTIHRKSFTVKPATFTIEDRGAPGRGRKVIPALKKGGLGGKGFFSKSTSARRRQLVRLAKRQSEKKIAGRLMAIAIFNKRVNPALSEKAFADRNYLMGTMRGRRAVGFPEGFKRIRRIR